MNRDTQLAWLKIERPLIQALIAFTGVILVDVGAFGLQWMGLTTLEPRFPYLTAASFLLCFAMFNALLSITAANTLKYWGTSIYAFLALAAGSVMTAWGLSGLRLSEAGSYWWILIVVTLGYLIFLALVNTIRNIVSFAQKEEWNQPRFRQRNKRSR